MRCACIDIGSNTTRLLVADVRGAGGAGAALTAVLEQRAFTQLGRACRPGERVPAGTCDALVAVVAEQAREAREQGAEQLRVVATAALRRAADGFRVVQLLAAATGVPVVLLSERDEARLAFAGATCELDGGATGPVGVVDVGGGSAQLVVGTCGESPAWSVSLPLGSGDLAGAHLRGDPPAARELEALRAAVRAALAEVQPPSVERALAVGGSATSLRRLAGERLDAAALERALETVVSDPAAEVAERTGIAPERLRLLPAGIAVLAAVAERMGTLEVARGGLREGVVRELAAR